MLKYRWIATLALGLVLAPVSPGADAPRKLPEYTINLTGGKTMTLSQYKGHPVVLAFILTACPHCQMTVGILSKLQAEYGPRGLQVVASANNPDAQAALPLFIKTFSPTFPVGYSTSGSAWTFIPPTGKMPMMPRLAFIDKQGLMRAYHEGEEPFFENLEVNLRKEIEALLKAGTPGTK